MQKGSDIVTGRPSTKNKSTEQRVATVDVKETDDKDMQVKERMATRKATAANKEKTKDNPSTIETVRQKVRFIILIFSF